MSPELIPTRYDEYLEHIYYLLMETHLYKSYLRDIYYFNNNRIEIINDSAPTFFVMCENAFVDSIIMRIARVTDPANTGTSGNLTIKTLFGHFIPENEPEYASVKRKLDDLDAQIANLRKRRNKQIGHMDLKSFGKNFPIRITDIEFALQLLEEIFNDIVQKLPEGLEKFKPDTEYVTEPATLGSGDAVDALIVLEKGRRYDALIESLSEECILALLPPEYLAWGRAYFQDEVVQFVCKEEISNA